MKVTLLVGGIVVKNDKILILQRLKTKKAFPGFWDLPGGKLDEGETVEEAVLRELREETGLDVTIIRPYHTWTFIFDFKESKEYCVQIDFLLKTKDTDKIILSETEHSEYQWIDEKSIPENMTKETRDTIKKAFVELRK